MEGAGAGARPQPPPRALRPLTLRCLETLVVHANDLQDVSGLPEDLAEALLIMLVENLKMDVRLYSVFKATGFPNVLARLAVMDPFLGVPELSSTMRYCRP